MPFTSRVGRVQSRSSVEKWGSPCSGHVAPVRLLVERHPGQGRLFGVAEQLDVVVEARHGDGALGRMQARQDPGQRVVGVLDRATVASRVQVDSRPRNDKGATHEPLGADRDRRLRRAPHRPVGRDDEVGGERLPVGLEHRGQAGAADLLLPFDQEADVERQPADLLVEGLGDLEGDEDRALVVRGAARIDASVVNRRLERRRLPVGLVPGRLHVVVPVDEDRRRPGGAQPFTEHNGVTARLHDPAAGERELACNPLGGCPHVGAMGGLGTHAGDPEELHELAQVPPAVAKRWNVRHRSRSSGR
jgi:hypothetical protein